MSLEQLIKGCKRGDRTAQATLYKEIAPKLLGVCYRYAGRTMDAHDLMQEAFITIFKDIQSFRGEGSFEGWARRVTVNICLANIRKNRPIDYSTDSLEEAFDQRSNEELPDQRLVSRELLDFISRLPTSKRTIFNLFVIEGYSHKEIAEMLDISEGTSKSQLARARQLLMEIHKNENKIDAGKIS